MGQSILSYRLNAVLKLSNVCTLLTYGRKGSGLIFPHFVTEKNGACQSVPLRVATQISSETLT